MQTRSIKQVEAITGNTPQELASNYNEAMKRLQGLNPKDEWHGDVVYIYYYTSEAVTECLADEHELEGDAHTCNECPFCVKKLNRFGVVDTRYKWAVCGKSGEPTSIQSNACDIYYTMHHTRTDHRRGEIMNKEIKIKMIEFDVNQKMLADHLGITQPAVSQMLNRELSEEKKKELIFAIEECALGA